MKIINKNTNAVLLTLHQANAGAWLTMTQEFRRSVILIRILQTIRSLIELADPLSRAPHPTTTTQRNFEGLLMQHFFTFTVNHKQHEAPSTGWWCGEVGWGGEGGIVERGYLWSNACLIEGSLTRKSLDSPPQPRLSPLANISCGHSCRPIGWATSLSEEKQYRKEKQMNVLV